MNRWMAFALVAVGCGGNPMMMNEGDVTMAEGDFHYYVVNKLVVPQQRTQFAIDLNGDGKVDNALGNIITALTSQNLDTQAGIDESVSMGSVVLLVSLQAKSLDSADKVGVTVYIGEKATMPDFMSGAGMFTVDAAASGSGFKFFGKINGKRMVSNNPVTTMHPVTMTLKLPLIAGSEPLTLAVNGAHVSFNTGTDMASNQPGLVNGELHGSIKNADIQGSIIPAVAMLLSDRVKGCMGGGGADGGAGDGGTCSSGDMQILQLFDTGMCKNPDNTMATAGDGKIDICEVGTNMIITNVLSPDIQVFAADGTTYQPCPKTMGCAKDSLSLGLGFTAVQSAKPTGVSQ